MEYQDESPMPSGRRDNTPYDEIVRRERRRRSPTPKEREAQKWAEHVVKINRKRKRPPYSVDSFITNLILGHKARKLKARAKSST